MTDFSRVVVTGLGAMTDMGLDVHTLWDGLVNGRSGVGPITAFEQDDQWDVRIAGEVKDWTPRKNWTPLNARGWTATPRSESALR